VKGSGAIVSFTQTVKQENPTGMIKKVTLLTRLKLEGTRIGTESKFSRLGGRRFFSPKFERLHANCEFPREKLPGLRHRDCAKSYVVNKA
jgi:hypothetical protein